jgi:hypothetical protein
MGMHPNAILLLRLKPNSPEESEKIYKSILYSENINPDDTDEDEYYGINIGDRDYTIKVMVESDYDEVMQISADEGDIVLYDTVTFDYGEVIAWEDLEIAKISLEQWADTYCVRFGLTASIFVTANYW